MSTTRDWRPTRRVDQLAMAKTWHEVLSVKGGQWRVTDAEISELADLIEDAENWLGKAMSASRTAYITAMCKEAFDALISYMRDMKKRKFFVPPLTDADLVSLGLKPEDKEPTTIELPTAQAEADISYPGTHLLELHIKTVPGMDASSPAHYGFAIHYGLMPSGGATVEQALGVKHYLMKPPASCEELTLKQFTRRKRETIVFSPLETGMTAFFCIRYENSKGKAGPWGPMFSAMIP